MFLYTFSPFLYYKNSLEAIRMQEITESMVQSDDLVILEDGHADSHDKTVILDENTIILAAGDTYSFVNMQLLKQAFLDTGLSYQDVSDEYNISVSAIYKFMAKKSKSPSFYNVVMLCKALGVSVDEFCGLRPLHKQLPEEFRARLDHLEDTIVSLQKTIESQNVLITKLITEIHRNSHSAHDEYLKDY